ETKFLVANLPVEVDGDPTEELEVSNYKDLKRIATNRIRGGVCIVISSMAQKAPKVFKEVKKWDDSFGLSHWKFLDTFLKIQKEKKAHGEKKKEGEKLTPDLTYISDLVAGRPVLGHPLTHGGFRLRYGRCRTSGYSSCSIHPATMHILNNFIASATQLKWERPSKGTAITVCDTIEGPIVKTDKGVFRLETEQFAKQISPEIKEILYLGDALVSYGDFFDRAHPLIPAGYCEEWWSQELDLAIKEKFSSNIKKASKFLEINEDLLISLIKNPLTTKIKATEAILISKKLQIPLHPRYTYHFSHIKEDEFRQFCQWLQETEIHIDENFVSKIVLPLNKTGKMLDFHPSKKENFFEAKRTLELMGIPHLFVANENIVIEKDDAIAFFHIFNLEEKEKLLSYNSENVLSFIQTISKLSLRDKSGTFIGARMGRPEKSKMRKLTGSPHVLFPVGEEGGRLRCFQDALKDGKITSQFSIYYCKSCKKESVFSVCENCNKIATKMLFCDKCGMIENCSHNPVSFKERSIDINYYFSKCLEKLQMQTYPDLIKGVRGTSNKDHIAEHLIKGILRAKHDIYVNKDGTTRYDMSEIPMTHFTPKEIHTSLEKLKQLGYFKDIHGNALTNENQILELKPHDVVLPSCPETTDERADDVLLKICNFVDDLLVNLYNVNSFYNIKSKEDLLGQLIIVLAPHICAGTVARVIGFSDTQGFYAHPLLHASVRRDADGDECCFILLMDALLNFSRKYLPDTRGARTMDTTLVLTSKIIPSEVDDMVQKVDVVWKYPIELYQAALDYKSPWEVKIEQVSHRINTPLQYESYGFTHHTSSINAGVLCSAYKALPSMEEKLLMQMNLAEKIRAVNESDVARLVIEKHFIKDARGNLRKFSTQEFRCVKCNAKFRRPPLSGKCFCKSGRIIFTVSEGSVIKYIEPSLSLAKKYKIPPYLQQSLDLTKRNIEAVFGKEKEKQSALGAWFG
ncbi:MAG: DNA polymerase II large subunit, partial [Candidatus Woesearchaeota archaeon]